MTIAPDPPGRYPFEDEDSIRAEAKGDGIAALVAYSPQLRTVLFERDGRLISGVDLLAEMGAADMSHRANAIAALALSLLDNGGLRRVNRLVHALSWKGAARVDVVNEPWWAEVSDRRIGASAAQWVAAMKLAIVKQVRAGGFVGCLCVADAGPSDSHHLFSLVDAYLDVPTNTAVIRVEFTGTAS